MKLKYFLAQFEGIDPETEIRIEYKEYDSWLLGHDIDIVPTYINSYNLNSTGDICTWSDNKNNYHNCKILRIKSNYRFS